MVAPEMAALKAEREELRAHIARVLRNSAPILTPELQESLSAAEDRLAIVEVALAQFEGR